MKRLLTILLVLGAWSSAWAVDGDLLSESGDAGIAAEPDSINRGVKTTFSFLLCDGDPGASGTLCGSVDVANPGKTARTAAAPTGLGWPTRAIFKWVVSTGCTSGTDTLTPVGADEPVAADSANFLLGPAGSTTLAAVDTSTTPDTASQMIVEPVVNRYLDAFITDADAGCTDSEVILTLEYDHDDMR